METTASHPLSFDVAPTKRSKDYYLISGYGLLLVSLFLFGLGEFIKSPGRPDFFTVFVTHYLLALAYIAILLHDGSYGIRKIWQEENIGKGMILLNLFLISAYALNRNIVVFEKSTTWLTVYILITSATTLSFQYFAKLPRWVNCVQYFILGSSIVFYLYLTIYVGVFYPAGTIGLLFFGIGGHIFAPLTLLIACGYIVYYHYQSKGISPVWLIAGAAMTFLCATVFAAIWTQRVERIERTANQSILDVNADLPVWVKIGQSIPNDWITERILKSDLVFTTPGNKFREWTFMPQKISWEEERKHDPLVFLASLNNQCHLAIEDRVKILQTISDVRHQSNERLWSGDNLTTSYIISDIDIYPDLRIAYTEKYISVRNNSQHRSWWGNAEEAIYTFQLPEGSVVTSLSLWINGVEEKGVLTSKQKAKEAYNAIVGQERRDPSVVHWQEGNTITVRVFPCTKEEERKFKLGITSPLLVRDGKVAYEKIVFKGPNPHGAKETIRLRIPGKQMEIPDGFKKDRNDFVIRENTYDPDFEISLAAVPFKKGNAFYFKDHQFSISEYKPVFEKTSFDKIYLDINNTWTSKELEELKPMIADKNIFVSSDNEFVQLDESTWELADDLQQRNFSLFPFHELKDRRHTLVITKGKPLSPRLSDFKESAFTKSISALFATGEKTYVYTLDGQSSTFINSLKELRAFTYTEGSLSNLEHLLKTNTFPQSIENDENVVIQHANLVISRRETGDSTASNAPDHLARLFAYNDILRKTGEGYFKGDYINEDLVAEASDAYVVSPVSSLIVLETKQDYDRFGITDSKDGLKNASKESSGAVPEPHEWLLIGLLLLFAVFVINKVKAGRSI